MASPLPASWLYLSAILLMGPTVSSAFDPVYERAPIKYSEREANTEVTRWFAKAKDRPEIQAGTSYDILSIFLKELNIPVESQILVFSKTSAQNSRISPETPRALYYSDDLYVGWVQGGSLEIASYDPELGMIFHLLKAGNEVTQTPPVLEREQSCLTCHAGSSNHNLPGLMVRSVYPAASGMPVFEAGSFHTRHSSPINERWGGWYVTGSVEGLTHLGNSVASSDRVNGAVTLEPMSKDEIVSLDTLFKSDVYLNGAQSDVLALMILEHQVGVHNILAEANTTTRATLHRHAEMQKAFGEPVDAPLSEANERLLNNLATRVLHEMLYVEEVALPGGIETDGPFPTAFSKNRIANSKGRSLYDLRLYERIMKYRCSHLIYSNAFTSLPSEIRNRILDQLHSILTQPEDWPEFAHLGGAERGHILSIVSETVPNLPKSWR